MPLQTPAIVDQPPLTGNTRSTIGTITDIYSMIRVLFACFGDPSSRLPSLYSFNDPKGITLLGSTQDVRFERLEY